MKSVRGLQFIRFHTTSFCEYLYGVDGASNFN